MCRSPRKRTLRRGAVAELPDKEVGSRTLARWVRRAMGAVLTHLFDHRELTPGALLRIVVAAGPRRQGRWLRRKLARHGWLAADAVVPFDVLDRVVIAPQRRAILQLALFGPGGQGVPY